MNFDSEAWGQFIQDHWIVVAGVLLAIIIVVKVVKTVMKWVLVAAIVIGFAVYGGYSIDDLKEVGSKVSNLDLQDVENKVSELGDKVSGKVTEELKNLAIETMAGEVSAAEYVDNADGSYTIKSKNLELNGVPNSGKVSVKLHGQDLGTWDMEGQVREFVVQSREAAQ